MAVSRIDIAIPELSGEAETGDESNTMLVFPRASRRVKRPALGSGKRATRISGTHTGQDKEMVGYVQADTGTINQLR